MSRQWFKLSKQLWPHHQASLWFFCSSRLPTPGITVCSQFLRQFDRWSYQDPAPSARAEMANCWNQRNVRLTELIIRVKTKEPLSMRLCSSRASGSSLPALPTQTSNTPTSPLSHVPAPHLVDFNLSKTMPLLLIFITDSARICKELDFFHLTWSEGQNPKAKLFALSRSFFSAWMVSKVLAVNASTFHLWLP